MADPADAPPPPLQHLSTASESRTSPIVRLLERDLEPADYELAARLRNAAGDPYTISARLIRALDQEKASSSEQLEAQLGAAIRKHDETLTAVIAEVRDLKRDASTAKWIVRGIFAAIGMFGLYGIDKVLARTEQDGEIKIRLQTLERAVDRFERERERRPDWAAPTPQTPQSRAADKP